MMSSSVRNDEENGDSIPAGAIVGSYVKRSSRFVGHVAILLEEVSVAEVGVAEKEVAHVRPPETSSTGDCTAHKNPFVIDRGKFDVACKVLSLESTKYKSIVHEARLAITSTTTSSVGYCAHPAFEEIRDSKTNVLRVRKASCSGFVLWCYLKGANITLLDWKDPKYPTVLLEELSAIYGEDIDKLRRVCSGHTSEELPIVLPGHILNAAQAPSLPFVPSQNDCEFPRHKSN